MLKYKCKWYSLNCWFASYFTWSSFSCSLFILRDLYSVYKNLFYLIVKMIQGSSQFLKCHKYILLNCCSLCWPACQCLCPLLKHCFTCNRKYAKLLLKRSHLLCNWFHFAISCIRHHYFYILIHRPAINLETDYLIQGNYSSCEYAVVRQSTTENLLNFETDCGHSINSKLCVFPESSSIMNISLIASS